MTRKKDDGRDILYHNESAILFENNGRLSYGKGLRHIDIRYFYVSDMVAKDEIRVLHWYPKLEMIADFFTKPLQGKLFRKFRDLILGIDEKDRVSYFWLHINALKDFGLSDDNIT
mmetsp:Transcript_101094/g.205123  ORF Transcript_101094/g.205123 Transcript_101094/m.205123 type:complete len:115 (+) Transcript_101094:236-580(+)